MSDRDMKIKITSIVKEYKKVPVYTLEINKNHNFFTNFLVHNKKGTLYMNVALFKGSDDSLVANGTQQDSADVVGRYDYPVSASISNATNYWLYVWAQSGGGIYYDAGGGNGVNKSVTYSTTWPNPLTGTTVDSNKYSIYATYIPAGTVKTNLKGGMNLRGNVNFR